MFFIMSDIRTHICVSFVSVLSHACSMIETLSVNNIFLNLFMYDNKALSCLMNTFDISLVFLMKKDFD